jgi:hypothetical protein
MVPQSKTESVVKQNAPAPMSNSRFDSTSALMLSDVFPNSLHLALFKAVLSSDSDFAIHWIDWASQLSSSGHVDPVSTEHLPLLRGRLGLIPPGTPCSNPLPQLIQNLYRRTWARNQLLFRSLRASLQTLHDAGVPTLVLKGAALLAMYYKDMGARTMGDFDVLVPQAHFLTAAQALEASGWTGIFSAKDFDPRFGHALTFKDGQGNFLDLHVHVLHFTSHEDADELFWANSVPMSLLGVETRTLCADDFILHLAVHGMRWAPYLPLRWIPDIAHVISNGDSDWNRLLQMAQHLHASLAVTTVLEYLNKNQLASVPESVLTSLRAIPIDPWEQKRFELNTRNLLGSIFPTIRFHWHIATQRNDAPSLLRRLQLLPAYVGYFTKIAGFNGWLAYLLRGQSLKKHLLAKLGRYARPINDPRLR